MSDISVRRILIVIPAYNEEQTIAEVIKGVKNLGAGYDVVVVDDSSCDDTGLKASIEGATVIKLPCNLGIGGAVQTGFKYAQSKGYDACVQVDGDGQHPTAEIPRLLRYIFEEGYDLVIGSRFVEDIPYNVSFMRNLGIKVLSIALKCATGLEVKDTTSGFRAINRRAIEFFSREYPQDYPEPESLILSNQYGFRVIEVPVQMNSRMYGASSITPVKSAYYMVKVLLAMFVDLFRKPRRI